MPSDMKEITLDEFLEAIIGSPKSSRVIPVEAIEVLTGGSPPVDHWYNCQGQREETVDIWLLKRGVQLKREAGSSFAGRSEKLTIFGPQAVYRPIR